MKIPDAFGTASFVLMLAAAVVPAPPESGNVISISPHIETTGSLDVRVYPMEGRLSPSADIVLVDPHGRRLGADPRTGEGFSEIPDSYYEYEGIDDDETGEPGPSTAVCEVMNPADGENRLIVIGREDGAYDIDVVGFGKDYESSRAQARNVATHKGAVHEYSLVYSNRDRVMVVLRRVK